MGRQGKHSIPTAFYSEIDETEVCCGTVWPAPSFPPKETLNTPGDFQTEGTKPKVTYRSLGNPPPIILEGRSQSTDLLCVWLFLCEDTQDEVCFFVGLEGGGNYDVFTRWQANVIAHFSQVDKGLWTCSRLVPQKEVLLQMNTLAALGLGEKHFRYSIQLPNQSYIRVRITAHSHTTQKHKGEDTSQNTFLEIKKVHTYPINIFTGRLLCPLNNNWPL